MAKFSRKDQIYFAALAIVREYKSFLAHVRKEEPGHSHLKIGLDLREVVCSKIGGADNLKLSTIERYTSEAISEAYEIARTSEDTELIEWLAAQMDKRK